MPSAAPPTPRPPHPHLGARRYDGRSVLIDTATELRSQALANGIRRVDAVLMTHAHADHTGGFDDLRRFNELQQRTSRSTPTPARRRCSASATPTPSPTSARSTAASRISSCTRSTVPSISSDRRSSRFRCSRPAADHWATASAIWRTSPMPRRFRILVKLLWDLDVLVLNALRERSHPTHLSFSEAVEIIETVRPRAPYLVHLSHETSHVEAEGLFRVRSESPGTD